MPNKYMGENSMSSLMKTIKGSIPTINGILGRISTGATPYQYATDVTDTTKYASIGDIPDGATRMMIFQRHQTYASLNYWVGYFYGIYEIPTSSKALCIGCQKISGVGLCGFINQSTSPNGAEVISFTKDGSVLKYSVYSYSSQAGNYLQYYPVSINSGPGYIITEIYFI